MTDRWRRTLEVTVVLLLGVVLALGYGSPYGTNNQMTYLLEPLVKAFPELYRRDWLVSETHHYEVPFAYLVAPLYSLDREGAVAFGIAQLVTMTATFAAIYALVAAVIERGRLTIFAGLAGLLTIGGGRALGGTYLFAGYLQPSSIASLAWLIAMVAWSRERRLTAGIALAIGGIFHINFCVLGIGAFGLAELCARKTTWKQVALLLVPSVLVLVAFSPLLIGSSRASEPELGLHVLTKYALTIHFWPKRVRYEWWALAGWLSIAWGLRDTLANAALVRLRWFALSCLGCCLVAVWLFSIPPLLTFTRLMVWRIAPFGQLAAQLMLIVGICRVARGEAARPRGWQLAALLVGAVAVVVNAYTQPKAQYPMAITVGMAACIAAVILRRDVIVRAACVVMILFTLWGARGGVAHPILFDTTDFPATKWARTTTPVDSLFLVPPYANNFRVLSHRAVVADVKSPPMYLDELAEWYRRLCTMVDAPSLKSIGETVQKWDELPADRILAIARTFHADYVVLYKGRGAARLSTPLVYEDASTLVYAVPPE